VTAGEETLPFLTKTLFVLRTHELHMKGSECYPSCISGELTMSISFSFLYLLQEILQANNHHRYRSSPSKHSKYIYNIIKQL
jgi:hypothetical protein